VYRGDDISPTSHEVRLVWWSAFVDGHIWVTVTSHHIFVHTGHDNPNPNVIYWVGPATEEQRGALERIVRSSPGLCDQWSCDVHPRERDARDRTTSQHLSTVANNIAEVFAKLTKTWPHDVPPLPLPDARALDTPRVFLFMALDVDGWLGACHRDGAGPLLREDGSGCPF
jgi:hypothetical protein